ncbi:upf0568 protein c14orf166 [Cystoisospora suis]|uniref:Upf0568 protein c14orf166 n=1 Tax=Cystoisospora suis TaxID=483139 RepID=A0A2C6LE47_9APIC|nr:upf0568 protein c14orf166 [Cystoisospora suis]
MSQSSGSWSKGPPKEPSLPLFIERKIRALGGGQMLQGEAKKNPSDWRWFRDVNVFLEEEKIRFYPRYKREALRTVEDPAKWWTLMLQYCRDLEAPLSPEGSSSVLPHTIENRFLLLDRLTTVAIGDIYMDAIEGEEISTREEETSHLEGEEALSQPEERHSGASTGTTAEFERNLVSLKPSINDFLRHLNLPPLTPSSSTDEIFSALKAIETRICCPSVSEKERGNEDKENVDILLKTLPLGYPSTGKKDGEDNFFRSFLCGLRAVHVVHMRETQAQINRLIEALQVITANPATDTRLGRVGV